MFRLRYRSSVLSVVVLVGTAWLAPASRAADNSWIGQKVILKHEGVKIGHTGPDGRPIYVADLTDIAYTVLKEEDGWLQVRQGGAADWFAKDSALLVDDAITYFDERLRINSRDALAYAHRGRAWRELGELERALRDFDDALALSPLRFGWLRIRGAFYEEKHAAWFRNRGALYEEMKDFDKAIRDYDEALRINPFDALTYLDRGVAWKGKKAFDKAVADYSEAIRLDPKWTDAHYNRANVYKARKEYDKAIADYSTAIRLDPKNADAYFNRASAYKARREYAKVVGDYYEVLRLEPNDADALDNLAWVLATCPDDAVRDGQKALDCASAACELTDAKSAYFLATVAVAFAEIGKFDLAIKWQKRALESESYEREEGEKARKRLKLFDERKPYREE